MIRNLCFVVACGILLALCAGALLAADKFEYKFADGQTLKYRQTSLSDLSFSLPDGGQQTTKMQSTSSVQFKGQGKEGDAYKVESEVVRSKMVLNGKEEAAPKSVERKRSLTVLPSGKMSGGSGDQAFAIVFPDRPLAKGDSFATERPASDSKGLPLKTTYTLTEIGVTVPGYSAPVAVFEAKVEVAGAATGKRVTLKEGSGKVVFDHAAGIVVQSKLAFAIDEESTLEGGKAPVKSSFAMKHEWLLMPK
ncbi:MAG: hypothetical protein HY815_15345 [Candidatus Riflebacteria bacterium]|nr:hypothetical protein [Candidatus Riflebacteria bacterium]